MLYKIYYLIGRTLESKKKWELALSLYLKIPNNTKTDYRIAFCYKQRKDYGNAIYFFKKAISKETTKAHWYYNLIESLLKLQKEHETLPYLSKVLKLDNNSKRHSKFIKNLNKELNIGMPQKDIFINSITQIDSENIKISILGNLKNELDTLYLYLVTRENSLDLNLFSHKIEIDSLRINKQNIFEATYILPLKFLTLKNSNIINHTWDFYLMINNNKTKLKYFEESSKLLNYHSFDLIPYKTNSKTFSLLSIRKNTNHLTNQKSFTLLLPNIHEKSNFLSNILKLANILVSLKMQVTLVALDLKVNPNNISISPQINFDYVSTEFLENKNKDIDFTSSNIIPSQEYLVKFNNYFSNLKTDFLYIPILGEFFINQILNLTDHSTTKIFGEYNKKRYLAYHELLSQKNEVSKEMIIKRVHSEHFFKNINSVSAIHLIYPEVEALFEKVTDTHIITTSSTEDSLLKEWENYLK